MAAKDKGGRPANAGKGHDKGKSPDGNKGKGHDKPKGDKR